MKQAEVLFGAMAWVMAMAGPAIGGAQAAPEILVKSVEGEVYVVEPGIDQPTDAFESMSLSVGTRIQTGEQSTCSLLIGDVAIVDLEPQTVFKIPEVEANKSSITQIELEYGGLWTLVETLGPGQSFEVMTRTAIGGVRGTQFRVHQPQQDESEGSFSMMEGELELLDRRDRRSLLRRLGAGREARLGPRGQFRGERAFDREQLRSRFSRFVRQRKDLGSFREWRQRVRRGDLPPEVKEKLKQRLQDVGKGGRDERNRRLQEKLDGGSLAPGKREGSGSDGGGKPDPRDGSRRNPGLGGKRGTLPGALDERSMRDRWLAGESPAKQLLEKQGLEKQVVAPITQDRKSLLRQKVERAVVRRRKGR